ncbi:alpha/beta hydrolase [Virgibacillus halodenitrificans]|uniref:alpha/beta hydrolase n=1 Tax=Virgibacillus halodenitrificans TaxID=1482 RepID=UPI00045D3D81|nr:alpha/beta hydrolase [Virgibacillus halodenitrificans]MCG1026792.1 alpha/beta hydrolase [Virgibacillus halodenitrificans]CDQ30888.1 Carboxylesterase NlhH [Virgibacillus halodenitrificans]
MARTCVYKRVADCEIKGELHPIDEQQAPLLVYIHGGGLIWGTKSDMNKKQIKMYNEAGFNVFSIDYRLAPETKLPGIKEDIEDLLIWLYEKAPFDFDREKIAVVGSSAGGYLALLTGTFTVRPKVIVSLYGYGDVTGDWYQKPSPHYTNMTAVPEMLAKQLIQNEVISSSPIEKRYAIYLYCRQQGKWLDYVAGMETSKLDMYCPIKNIDSDFPETLLLHGDADEDVPYEESVKMKHMLDEANVPNKLITIPGGKHSFDMDMDNQTAAQAIESVITYLQKTLIKE